MTLAELQTIRRERDKRPSLDDEFYCRPRRRRLTIERCLDDFMNANAFDERKCACYRCPQGAGNRQAYAEGM
jgi:hypothetical protein